MESSKRPRTRFFAFVVIGAVGIAGALALGSYERVARFAGTENYAVDYPRTYAGWHGLPHTAQTLFLYEEPKEHLLLRGAVSQVISDINPTPELNTKGIAQYYVDRTHENMPQWTAKVVGDIHGKNVPFTVIERQGLGKTVITAFAAQGNTTLMVTVSEHTLKPEKINEGLAALTKFVSNVGLNQKDMGGGSEAADELDAPIGKSAKTG